MENTYCDYCEEKIDGEPEYTHEDSGCVYCCDPCYDEATEAVRAADAHDRHFGFAAAIAYDPARLRGEW